MYANANYELQFSNSNCNSDNLKIYKGFNLERKLSDNRNKFSTIKRSLFLLASYVKDKS